MKFLILAVFSLMLTSLNAQLKTVSSVHDKIDPKLIAFLEDENLGKIRIYYDEISKKEGEWDYYPVVNISENLIAVHVSTLPNIQDKYSFLLLINLDSLIVTDTLGPFYDSYIEAIESKVKNNQINYLKIKLVNPPSQFDPRYTFVEFKRKAEGLVEYKSYNKK